MNPGRLRHRIELHRRATATDALGQQVGAWSLVARTWASVQSIAGSEAQKGGRDVETHALSFRVRYRPNYDTLQAGDRLLWKARSFRILSAVPALDGRDEWLDITATHDAV